MSNPGDPEPIQLLPLLIRMLRELEAANEPQWGHANFSTGLQWFDDLVTSARAGDVVAVVGRDQVLVGDVVRAVAAGASTLLPLLHIEPVTPPLQVVERMVAANGGIPTKTLLAHGPMEPEMWPRVSRAIGQLGKHDLHVARDVPRPDASLPSWSVVTVTSAIELAVRRQQRLALVLEVLRDAAPGAVYIVGVQSRAVDLPAERDLDDAIAELAHVVIGLRGAEAASESTICDAVALRGARRGASSHRAFAHDRVSGAITDI